MKSLRVALGLALCLSGCRVVRKPQNLLSTERVLKRSASPAARKAIGAMPDPTQYEIDLTIDPSLDRYTAKERVLYTNRRQQPLDRLVFHAYPNASFLNPEGGQRLDVDSARINGNSVRPHVQGILLELPLRSQLPPGERVLVSLEFHCVVPTSPPPSTNVVVRSLEQLFSILGGGGKMRGDYGIYQHCGDVLSLGHWFPILAACGSRGWDEEQPSGIGDIADFDVAMFEVTIHAPEDLKVITSGLESRRRGNTVEAVGAPMRDFALQCSAGYETLTATVGNAAVNSHFLPPHANKGKAVLGYTSKALEYFSKTFDAYPYRELDVVEAPLQGAAGGMEFPGLVTISSLFYEEETSQPGLTPGSPALSFGSLMDEMLEFVVVHEVAHQWWNAVVGSDSKADPFLDEALANYSTLLYYNDVHSPAEAERQAYLEMQLNYQLHRLFGGRDAPVAQRVRDFRGEMEYAAIVYGKGALFFRALEKQVGKEQMLRMLRAYYDRNAFRRATPGELTSTLERESGQPEAVRETCNHWLRETHGDEDLGSLSLVKVLDALKIPGLTEGVEGQQLREAAAAFDNVLGQLQSGKGLDFQGILKALDDSGLGDVTKSLDEMLKGLGG